MRIARFARPARLLLCLGTGAALALAFPSFNHADAAWFLLVPLLVLLRFSTPREGFRYGFVFGVGFWLVSIFWLMELRNNGGPVALVAFGLIGLSAWCSLFVAFFGMATSFLWQGGDSTASGWRRNLFEVVRAPSVALLWCGAEYLRSTLLTGFAWNALGVSQAGVLPIAQAASLGGVYAVSFVVVLVNAGVAGAGVRIWRSVRGVPHVTRRHFDLMLALLVLMTLMVWGAKRVQRLRLEEARAETVIIGAVDPSLPCIFESNDAEWRTSYRLLSESTQQLSMTHPDLIVWPETVLYTMMPDERLEDEMLAFVEELGAPILAGGTEEVLDSAGVFHIFNSSFLFGATGVVESVYRKQHLVPFGEFIPFDKAFPFLQRFAPAGISCSPGKGPVVMVIADGRTRVSPLICFEDTVAGLSRDAVKAGAQILIAQSNDAWFYGSAEAEQHHAQAIFRTIENGVPLVRSSNRGVTAVVSSFGESTENANYFSQHVPLVARPGHTVYAKAGDWLFGIPSALFLCGLLGVLAGKRVRQGAEMQDH